MRTRFSHQGVYLHGAVGAGKTWMMDMFYSTLSCKKIRLHFHQFMREVHQELKALQGIANPLKRIAKNLAARAQVVCFDELFVNDIGDAMLLGELFQAMFQQGIILVMTSNVAPDNLYRNGLQRSRFLPAIHLLNEKMELIQVKSLKDYRWRHALDKGVFFHPLNPQTAQAIQTIFNQLSLHEEVTSATLMLQGRDISCVARGKEVLWCRFDQLCAIPRSAQDYVSLSKQFKIFILDKVPILKADEDNAIWYLISLVDVLYDAKCKLILRAEAPPRDLYRGSKLHFEFQRTLSRLHEMQTEAYWN
jgi:cell division protein ZapE